VLYSLLDEELAKLLKVDGVAAVLVDLLVPVVDEES